MNGKLPNKEGRTHRNEIDVYYVVIIGPSVEIVDDVFKDKPKIVDRHRPGKPINCRNDDSDEKEKVDAAAIEASL